MAVDQKFKDLLTGPNPLYDFILAEDESVTTEGTWQGLKLATDENGRPSYSVGRTPYIGTRISSGGIRVEDRDPLSHLVWRQDDFSGSALVRNADERPNGYLRGSMDGRFPNMLAPGIARNFGSFHSNTDCPIGVGLLNPFFEAPSGDEGWTDDSGANGTVDFDNTEDARPDLFGAQACKITATASGNMISQSLANPTVWQSKEINFSIYFKKSVGVAGIQLIVSDGVGSTTGTAVTSASDWTLVTVSHTCDASASEVTLIVDATGAFTGHVDDATIYGSTDSLAATRSVTREGDEYQCFGQLVCKLDASTEDAFKWDVVHVGSADATDIEVYEESGGTNHVFVAFGGSTAYVYGSDTTWTASTLTGNSKFAIRFAVSRNTLWKSETVNTVKSSTGPDNAGAWGSAYTVGSTDHEINRLFAHDDTVYVGKEDGFWYYRRVYDDGTSADVFENRTNEFRDYPSTDNFRVGHVHFDDALYLNTALPGFVRIKDRVLESLDVFAHPEADAKGLVRAIAGDAYQLWCFVDADLYSVRFEGGRAIPHTPCPSPSVSPRSLAEFSVETLNTGATSAGAGANRDSGTDAWLDATLGNITASDDSRVFTDESGTGLRLSDHLQATSFGFAIPAAVTILGIEVSIEKRSNTAATIAKDSDVKLLKAGSQVGNNKADTVTRWNTGSDGTATYGSSTDLWGTSWSSTDINDSNFGVEIQASLENSGSGVAMVDHISITVYYQIKPSQANIAVKHAAVVYWDISSTATPHLLGTISGIDSNDSIPYALTDVWALPRDSIAPFQQDDDLPWSPTTQQWFSSEKNFRMPTETKVASHLEVLFKDMDATQPVTWKFGINGADGDTTALGTMDSSETVQTLFFGDITDAENATAFKSISLYAEGSYSGSRNQRKILAFELHCIPVSEVIKTFTLTARMGGAVTGYGAVQDDIPGQSGPELLSTLEDTFEAREFSFYLIENFNRDGDPDSHVVTFRPQTLELTPSNDGGDSGDQDVRFVLQTSLNKE